MTDSTRATTEQANRRPETVGISAASGEDTAMPPACVPGSPTHLDVMLTRLDCANAQRLLVGLQRSAGNRQVGTMVERSLANPRNKPGSAIQRSPLQRKDVALAGRMTAAETTFNAVAATAAKRSTALSTTADKAIESLKAAKDHLKESNTVYTEGYNKFKGQIAIADAQAATDKALEDAVQGVLVAMALTAITVATCGTGAVAASAALTGFRAVATHTLKEVGKAGVGEVAEIATGKGVDAVKGDPATPGGAVAGAGDTPGQRFEQAFGHLDRMIDALSAGKLGFFASSQTTLAMEAKDLAAQAIKLGAGQTVDKTAEQIEADGMRLKELDTANASVDTHGADLLARVNEMKAEILKVKKPTDAGTVERQLWTNWMANLGDKNELLDNDAIQKYLGPEGLGMMDWGGYMFDSDQVREMSEAQRELLAAEGVNLPADMAPEKVSAVFFSRKALQDCKTRFIGKMAEPIPSFESANIADTAIVDGVRWGIVPVNTGGASTVLLKVIDVVITYPDVIKNDWTDADFTLVTEKPPPPPKAQEPCPVPELVSPASGNE